MNISDTNNRVKIFGAITSQYEQSPRLTGFICRLSDLGYISCGEVFDQIIDGIVNLYGETTLIAKCIVAALVGFDEGDPTSPNFISQIYGILLSRMFGIASYAEFLVVMSAFSHTYSVTQLSLGGRVTFSFDGGSTEISDMVSLGAPIAVCVHEKSAATPDLKTFVFTDSSKYDSTASVRLCSDDEMSFYDVGGEYQSWTLDDVYTGNIWRTDK